MAAVAKLAQTPLEVSDVVARTEAVSAAFAAIGRTLDMGIPQARDDPREQLAVNYLDATLLLRLAEIRRKAEHRACVKGGVLIDHEKAPEPVGTNRLIYSGSVVQITLTVAAPIVGIDHAAFVEDLLKAGVKPALIKRLQAKHATETRPAHKFTPVLVTV